MDHLNFNHLYYFWMIAHEGGVTAACRKLHLAQPTLSRQLKIFEENIGRPLFRRAARKLSLTDEGRIVYDYADAIFKTGQQLVDTLRDRTQRETAPIACGVIDVMPRRIVHTVMKDLLSQKKIHLNITVGHMQSLMHQLMHHQLDFVLTDEPAPPEIKGLFSCLLFREPVVFAGTTEFKSLRRQFPESLNAQPLYLPAESDRLTTQVELFFKHHNVSPSLRGHIQDGEMQRLIAVGSHGIVVLPLAAISDLVKSRELVVLGQDNSLQRDIYLLVTHKSLQENTVLSLLKKYGTIPEIKDSKPA